MDLSFKTQAAVVVQDMIPVLRRLRQEDDYDLGAACSSRTVEVTEQDCV